MDNRIIIGALQPAFYVVENFHTNNHELVRGGFDFIGGEHLTQESAVRAMGLIKALLPASFKVGTTWLGYQGMHARITGERGFVDLHLPTFVRQYLEALGDNFGNIATANATAKDVLLAPRISGIE